MPRDRHRWVAKPGSRWLSLGVAIGLFLGLARPASSAETAPKQIDLKIASGVASIATRADGHGFVAAFANCKVAFLGSDGVLQSEQTIEGCQHLFTIHIAPREPTETVTASIYTGHSVILSEGHIAKVKTHEAAVTDVFLAFGGLLNSSDDGTVVLSTRDGYGVPKLLVSGQGVARILLPDLSASIPAFFQGFDSGRVVAFAGSRSRTFDMGVGRINGLALSADRTTLYAGGFNGRVRQATLASGATQDIFSGGGSDINAIDLDPTTSRLAIAVEDGRLVVLDMSRRATLIDSRISKAGLTAVALRAGGRGVLAGDETGLLYLLDLPGRNPPGP